MKDTLLQYVLKVDAVTPTAPASTTYLHRALCVVKGLPEVTTGVITRCTTKAQITALTTAECWRLLDHIPEIYVLPADDLNIADILASTSYHFFTILIDGAFDNDEIGDYDYGQFTGVTGWAVANREHASAFAKRNNNVGFYDLASINYANFYYAFGKLLGANSWRNQQYIEMPYGDGINTINLAEGMYDDKISFVLTSEQYGHRLALFASNQRAIIAPYIYEELTIKLQSETLRYISLNQPNYTEAEASLLEDALQSVGDAYVEDGVITEFNASVELSGENFITNATFRVAEPKALWRVKAVMYQGV